MNYIDPEERYPISSFQKMIYMDQYFDKSNVGYNIAVKCKIGKDIQTSILEEAFYQTIDRNEILKSNFQFVDGEIYQFIRKDFSFQFKHVNEEGFDDVVMNRYIHPFDLENDLLIRGYVLHSKDGDILLLEAHHIILDGLSVAFLFQSVMDEYLGVKKEQRRDFQYKDFAIWQNEKLKNNEYAKQKLFWNEKLGVDRPVLDFKLDYPRGNQKTYQGKHVVKILDFELTEQIKKACMEYKISINTFLVSIYSFLLYKYTGQKAFIIGSVTHGRTIREVRRLIGMFNNFVPIKLEIDNTMTIFDFMQNNEKIITEYYTMGDYPYTEILRDLNLETKDSRNPLFDVMLIFQSSIEKLYKVKLDDGLKEGKMVRTNTSKLDFKLDVFSENDGSFELILEYSQNLFKQVTMERFLTLYINLIHIFINQSSIKLSEVELLSKEEQKKITTSLCGKKCDYIYQDIFSSFEKIVKKYPDKCALRYNNDEMIYQNLYKQSLNIAASLVKSGIKKGDKVIIRLNQSFELISSILAVLCVGGAYVPVATSQPKERLEKIIKSSGAKILIIDCPKEETYNEIKSLLIKDCIEEKEKISIVRPNISAEDPAYVLFTSGTTGQPKGVIIQQKNVINLIYNSLELYQFSSSDVWSQFHTYCFDFSVWEIFGALLYGAKLVLIPELVKRDPYEFLKIIYHEKVTVLNQTPTAFANLISEEKKHAETFLESVNYVIFGGENLKPSILKDVFSKYKNIQFVNMYGITETTVHVTFKKITKDLITSDISNVGKPIPNVRVLILDENMKMVPIGGKGEIYVGGEGVSSGYQDNMEETKKRFIMNPYKKSEIIYASGDVGYLLDDYEIEYIGRNDNQIQLQGHRIELKEIEKTLLACGKMIEAYLCVIEKDGKEYLCSYFISNELVTVKEIRKYMSNSLPSYMIPTIYVRLEYFPLNKNCKIDTERLPEPITNIPLSDQHEENELELSPFQKKTVTIWKKCLDISEANLRDNFFDIGGNSMVAVRLVEMLNHNGIEISVMDIFKNQTLEELFSVISEKKDSNSEILSEVDLNIEGTKRVCLRVRPYAYEYDWLELDCFHRPVSIIFENLQQGYGDIILLFSSYAYSHFILNYMELLSGENFEISRLFVEFYHNNLESSFGILIEDSKFETKNEFIETMIETINNSALVLLPIDLYELFYTCHYKEEHHIHYLIIKGYDNAKKLFIVQDNEHINNSDTTYYSTFSLKFDDVYQAHQSYLKTFLNRGKQGYCLTFRKATQISYCRRDGLLDFCKLLSNLKGESNGGIYFENELVKMHKNGVSIDINRSIIYILNIKMVYFQIVNKLLENRLTQEIYNKRFKDRLILIHRVCTDARRIYYQHYDSGNNSYTQEEDAFFQLNVQQEIDLENELISLYSDKLMSKDEKRGELIDQRWVFFNNDDNALMFKTNMLSFIQSKESIYLTWFYEDNAPQLLMPATKDNFMLEGSLSTNTEKGTRFFTGIIVKFDSERKILFGNYRNRKTSIFFPEEQMNFAVKEKSKVSNYLDLRIECSTSEIKFLLREKKGADFQTLMISKLEEKVLYVGFFSNKHDRFNHEAYITEINYEVY